MNTMIRASTVCLVSATVACGSSGVRVDPAAFETPDAASIPDSHFDAGTAADAGMGTSWCEEEGAAPTGFSCAGASPRATPAELCASPRADPDAEFLAIEVSGAFMAPQALYERVSRDLAAVRAVVPETRAVRHMPSFFPGVLLDLTPEAAEEIRAGTFAALNCLDAYYGGWVRYLGISSPWASVRFKPIVNSVQLASDYAALPGVVNARSNGVIGDSTDICLSIEGDAHVYIFDAASGDCMSGCIDHEYYGASVEPDGSVTVLGSFDPAVSPGSWPEWLTSRWDECGPKL